MKHPLQHTAGILLAPFSFAYRALMALRRWLFTAQKEGGLFADAPPVISVGNISWGGTGKSVVVEYLLALFTAEASAQGSAGYSAKQQVAVLTRGYGVKLQHYPCILMGETLHADPKTSPEKLPEALPEKLPEKLPDEPRMLARRHPTVPVVIDPKRTRGAEELLTDLRFVNTDLIVLDDAFQHIAMPRDVDLVLLGAEDFLPGYWNRVIPWGTWREGEGALRAADAFLIKTSPKEWENLQGVALEKLTPYKRPIFLFRFEVDTCYAAATGVKHYVFPGGYILVSGVANPQPVYESAAGLLGPPVEHRVFADHYIYTAEDANSLSACGLPVVCTEKDAVKLESFAVLLPVLYVVQGRAVFFASYGAAPFDIWIQEQV